MSDFGRLLRKYRDNRGLTQEKLAEMAGVTISYISHLESDGPFNPSRRRVLALAEALELEPDEHRMFVYSAGYVTDTYSESNVGNASSELPPEIRVLPSILKSDELSEPEKENMIKMIEMLIEMANERKRNLNQ